MGFVSIELSPLVPATAGTQYFTNTDLLPLGCRFRGNERG
jgi:hypothetical protein